MRVVAVIPARSGSKGIPNKNIKSVAGKPLICWSIEAAIESKYIDRIIITSDGDNILEISGKYEEVVLVKRPDELAQDDTPTAPVIVHALKETSIEKDDFDYLILLQPTSPLRNAGHIDQAFEKIMNSDATALISVTEPEHHPLKSLTKDDQGFLVGIVNNQYPFQPRQELPAVYQPNGAIYIVSLNHFIEDENFYTNKTIEFLMSPEISVDIDTLEDIKKVEKYVNG